MRILRWVLLALVAVLLILFAVSNRQAVSVGLWPLPAAAELPLYVVVLGTLIVGFFSGELLAWTRGWRWRREARRSRERIATLERELEAEQGRRNEAVPLLAVPR